MELLAGLSDHIHIYNFPLPIFYMQEQLGIFDEPDHSFENARGSGGSRSTLIQTYIFDFIGRTSGAVRLAMWSIGCTP